MNAPRRPLAAIAVIATLGFLPQAAAHGEVRLERKDDRVEVSIDGQPFTSYVFKGHAKPILFPILGPGGLRMTRSWPVEEGVDGEAHDHPHHQSLWFMHGSVNGVDFWSHASKNGAPRPRVEQTSITGCTSGTTGVLETADNWCAPDGTIVCTDTRRIEFAGDSKNRSIDYSVTLHADHGAVTLGDTKEGTMAIRVATQLQPADVKGSKGAAGRVVNSEGLENTAAWGKKARWVDYSGRMGGRPDASPPQPGTLVGIAMFDHPDNLRHPCCWHARDYGLFAANPFGLHDFTGAAEGSGDHTIPAGGTLTLRYLFLFHEGDASTAGLEDRWKRWAAGTTARAP
ncbi:MAG: hypothetical protein EBZ59_04015 [Planctomycetia bacterium]|nr:hypothetical protein [Planctomycetia bacterium]